MPLLQLSTTERLPVFRQELRSSKQLPADMKQIVLSALAQAHKRLCRSLNYDVENAGQHTALVFPRL